MLGGETADGVAVVCLADGAVAAGVDDVGDVARADSFLNLVAALADLADDVGADAVCLEELRRALGGLDVEAEVIEAADERQRLLLVRVRDGGEHGAVVEELHPGGLERLIQRAV